jgi:NADH-quinone oxidoreductase subunit H
VLAPVFSFVISLIGWGLIPFSTEIHGINVYFGLLFSLAISSLGVYGVIVSGWSSNSKYAFLGAIRAAAQMLSYELTLSFSVLPVIIVSGSLNYIEIVAKQNAVWFIVPLLPAGIIFLISALAETNRTPFDLPEAEGELVAGFNVEYSSMTFALFFLAEYSNIVMISALFVILFLGGWTCFGMASSLFFAIKICALIYLFVWIRAMLPRYRFDQLLELGWKVLLPLTMSYFLLVSGTLLFTVNL